MNSPFSFSGRFSQRGLSLVELMISITLGLLILSALTTLFVNQSRTRAELDKSNRMIDNGRYALELLSENLRLAGFYGDLDPSSIALPASIDDPCSVDPAVIAGALRLHVGGYDAADSRTQYQYRATHFIPLKNDNFIGPLRPCGELIHGAARRAFDQVRVCDAARIEATAANAYFAAMARHHAQHVADVVKALRHFLPVLGACGRVADEEHLDLGFARLEQPACKPQPVVAALRAIRSVVQDHQVFHNFLRCL